MEERQLLTDGDVTVTTTRLVTGAQTYALRNITSVKFKAMKPHDAAPIVFGVIAAALILVAIISSSWFAGAFAVGAGLLAWGAWRVKPMGRVILVSSGEEKVALTTDHDRARRVFDAVNQAMASH